MKKIQNSRKPGLKILLGILAFGGGIAITRFLVYLIQTFYNPYF